LANGRNGSVVDGAARRGADAIILDLEDSVRSARGLVSAAASIGWFG
jgi:citrate lyase beta subunit